MTGSNVAASATSTAIAGNSVCMPATSHTSGGKLANSATQAQRSFDDVDSRPIAAQTAAAVTASQSASTAPRPWPRDRTATMPCRISLAQGAYDQT